MTVADSEGNSAAALLGAVVGVALLVVVVVLASVGKARGWFGGSMSSVLENVEDVLGEGMTFVTKQLLGTAAEMALTVNQQMQPGMLARVRLTMRPQTDDTDNKSTAVEVVSDEEAYNVSDPRTQRSKLVISVQFLTRIATPCRFLGLATQPLASTGEVKHSHRARYDDGGND